MRPGADNMSRPFVYLSLIFTVVSALGCGSAGPAMQQVSGNVATKQGKPCDNALIVFHPQEAERVNASKPFAKTDSQGNFKLTTDVEGDGALIGKYGVTIVWQTTGKDSKLSLSGEGEAAGADKLKGKYANPSKPLITADVKSGSDNRFDFTVEE
jgi:hypothetical protein